MCKNWPKIEVLLRQPEKYPRITIDLSELSPLPEEMLKIPMGAQINPLQFIEIFCWNILTKNLRLKRETWNVVKEIYDCVKVDQTLNMFLDMMLVVSKLDIDEYCQYYKKDASAVNEEYFEERFLFNFLTEINSRLAKEDIIQANQNNINLIKQSLLRPAIMEAFEDGLRKVGLETNSSKIRLIIKNMQIYFSKSLGNEVQAMALRNGILVSIFSSDTDMRLKAWIITKCCHETAHYLAREISGDYNFSSPKFCTDNDPIEITKAFELGRYIELRLFEMQPNWIASSEQAAIEFINNALVQNELPLIRKREDHIRYLVAREYPSLSFAADLEEIHTEGI